VSRINDKRMSERSMFPKDVAITRTVTALQTDRTRRNRLYSWCGRCKYEKQKTP